jgi:hypothetical protein
MSWRITSGSVGVSSVLGFEGEAWRPLEDPVVRYQRNSQVRGGRSDPAIRIVLGLTEGVTGSMKGAPELDAGLQERRSQPDDLGPCDVLFHPPEPLRSSAADSGTKRISASVWNEIKYRRPARTGPVEVDQRALRASEVCAEDVCVDHDRAGAQASHYRAMAARNLASSSSVRSSITGSSAGSHDLARANCCSTGS